MSALLVEVKQETDKRGKGFSGRTDERKKSEVTVNAKDGS